MAAVDGPYNAGVPVPRTAPTASAFSTAVRQEVAQQTASILQAVGEIKDFVATLREN